VPRGFVARMRHGDPGDPLLRQVLPCWTRMRIVPGFGLDAVGDGAATRRPG
jgi:L-lysine 2,3-aminomutase